MSLTTRALERGRAGGADETFGDLDGNVWAVRDGSVVAWGVPGERWAEGQANEQAAKDRFASIVKKLSRRSDVAPTPADGASQNLEEKPASLGDDDAPE